MFRRFSSSSSLARSPSSSAFALLLVSRRQQSGTASPPTSAPRPSPTAGADAVKQHAGLFSEREQIKRDSLRAHEDTLRRNGVTEIGINARRDREFDDVHDDAAVDVTAPAAAVAASASEGVGSRPLVGSRAQIRMKINVKMPEAPDPSVKKRIESKKGQRFTDALLEAAAKSGDLDEDTSKKIHGDHAKAAEVEEVATR